LLLAATVAASSGAGGFISTIGVAAVIVGIVGIVRNGIRSLAIGTRAAAGLALGVGVAVLLVGGGVSAATRAPGAEAGGTRGFVDANQVDPSQPSLEPEVVHDEEAVEEPIPFDRVTVEDATIAEGTTTVTTPGVNGVQTIRYVVTYTDGVETARRMLGQEVTVAPIAEVTTVGTMPPRAAAPGPGRCDPNYDPCVPIASDVDCAGGSGDGPAYVSGPVRITGRDVYGLDSNGDGYGCESS